MMSYTYLVKCKVNNNVYYGVRWGNKLSPKEDLWIKYFTSSKVIKNLITLYGKESFDFEIRKIFINKTDAIVWEETVLRRSKIFNKPNMWLNKCVSKAIRYKIHPNIGITLSEETRTKIANSLKGKKASSETRLKQSLSRKGTPNTTKGFKKPYITIMNRNRTLEQKRKFQEACVQSHSKTYKLLSPQKEEIIVINLAKFARENKFDSSAILKHNKAKKWILLERL